MRALGRAAVVEAPRETPPCDACQTAGQPTESRLVDGGDVTVCVAYAPCIARAKTAGAWKT